MHREVRTGGADKGGTKVRISSSSVDMYSNRTYSVENYEERTVQENSKNVLVLVPDAELESKKSGQITEETVASTEVLEKMSVTENGQEEAEGAEENKETRETADNETVYIRTGKIATAQEQKDTKTIRQRCIQYLLEVLLLNRERTLNGQGIRKLTYQEWLEENTNQNSQTTNTYMYSRKSTHKSKQGNGIDDKRSFTDVLEGIRVATKTTVQTGTTCYFSEKERTAYQTKGTVVTADGKSIEFNLQFAMSRSFEKYYNENYETSVISFCDPLIINLDSTMPEVSDQKFLFDLDTDGVMDTISMLSNKSGYLAIDKNKDGNINDGSELFGTKSGDGFKDLAEYDNDGNGWIDEGDEIWDKLMIWCMDDSGKTELYHISEKGIGAICLKNISSDFSLNSLKTNQTNAAVRNTGIFLYENGNVGTVQHMDLAI